MKTALSTDALFLEHDPGPHHPESPARLRSILRVLEPLPAGALWIAAPDATREQLSRVHTEGHLAALDAARGRSAQFDQDTPASPQSVPAAIRAAGATVRVTEAVVRGEAANGFALVRPPGHHAESSRAMGFCLLNNVAVAAAHAVSALGLSRVLVVDWDVHHGNGTQHIFEDRRDVMYMSSHRFPFYPGTGAARERGAGAGEGFTVNAPLPAGMGDGDYRAVYEEVLLPVALEFAPELVLVSAGFDPFERDPLGGMNVTVDGFAWLCGLWKRVAEESCGGKIALVLEGGYDLDGLAGSARACAEVLCGATPPEIRAGPSARGKDAVEEARQAAGKRWRP